MAARQQAALEFISVESPVMSDTEQNTRQVLLKAKRQKGALVSLLEPMDITFLPQSLALTTLNSNSPYG